MRKIFDKLYVPEKNDFEELVKSLYGRADRENLSYKYQFLNSDYTKYLYSSYSQKVVLKIITRGTGKRHLSLLIDYCHPKMIPKLEKQQNKAIEYLDKRIHDVFREMGNEQEDGMSRGR